MSTKLRRGFRKEIDDVFAAADVMACSEHPDDIKPKRVLIEQLRKELWTTIRMLQKQAKGATK